MDVFFRFQKSPPFKNGSAIVMEPSLKWASKMTHCTLWSTNMELRKSQANLALKAAT